LSGKQISQSVIPLPPLAEQHRIVAKVDELMALCDPLEQEQADHQATHQTLVKTLLNGLIESAKHPDPVEGHASTGSTQAADYFNQLIAEHFDTLFTTEQSIDQLKQTILQLAVMGKLVPQDTNDEPASVLLEKIAEEKIRLIKAGKIKKQKALPEVGEDERLFELPSEWEWVSLQTLLAIVTDGDHQAPPKSDNGIPFLVIGNLNQRKVTFDNCRYVPETYYTELDWSRKPLKGDILYTVTGSYGIPIPVESIEPFCVQRHVAIFKATKSSPINYLSTILEAKYAFEYATEIATGIAQKTVPLTGLRKMPIPLPPLAEQHRIVSKVNQLLTLCDSLKVNLNQAQTTQTQLADAIVKQAVN
jgi:type I restriction enzyme S subunit